MAGLHELPTPAQHRAPRRVRRPRARSSIGLEIHHVEALAAAAGFAKHHLRYPLNVHVTITLGDKSSRPNLIARLLERLRHWQQYRGSPGGLFVWVRERGPDLGDHIHIGAHLPAGSTRPELTRAVRRWLHQAGADAGPTAVEIKRARAVNGLLRYFSKGLTIEAHDELVSITNPTTGEFEQFKLGELILRPWERRPGGHIVGKRCGWSQGLGLKARTAWEARRKALQPLQGVPTPQGAEITQAA